MQLTPVQDHAIQAILASTLGAEIFDRLFSGVCFDELDDTMLYVYVRDEDVADEIAEKYAQHVVAVASRILRKKVGFIVVLEGPAIDLI
jgi:hypothetical protein